MATLSYGPLIDGARGSIGGTTFGRSISGFTARRRPRPPLSRLPRQIINRQFLAVAATTWRGLATALQEAWADYAATVTFIDSLGKSYHPSPINAFVRSYTYELEVHPSAPITARPTADGLPAVPTITWDYLKHNLRMVSCTPDIGPDQRLTLYVFNAGPRTVFNTQHVHQPPYTTDPDQYPWEIAGDMDTGLSPGQLLRAHIFWRFRDDDFRLSTLQHAYVNFTST